MPTLGIPAVHDLDEILTIRGAGGGEVPYSGYIEIEVGICQSSHKVPVLALVVPQNAYSEDVPLVLGTNVLKTILITDDDERRVNDDAWKMASKTIRMLDRPRGILGYVKSTSVEIVAPGQKKLISGVTRACAGIT